MPNAIITKTTIASGFTQSSFVSALVAALNSCGFSSGTFLAQGTVSGAVRTVYSHQFNASTKGTAYIEYEVNSTATSIVVKLSDNYNTSTFTATGQTSRSFTITNAASYDFYAINHPEIRGISLLRVGATTHEFLGILRPGSIPAWWNENSHLYCLDFSLINTTTNFCFPNPYATSVVANAYLLAGMISNGGSLSGANGGNTSDLIAAPLIGTASRGVAGQLSSDFVVGRVTDTAGNALIPGDKYVVSSGVQEYQYIGTSASTAGFGIRVV